MTAGLSGSALTIGGASIKPQQANAFKRRVIADPLTWAAACSHRAPVARAQNRHRLSGLRRQLDIEAGSARLNRRLRVGREDVENQKGSAGTIAGCLLAGTLVVGTASAVGAPDLEGTWTNASLTRFERPAEYGNRRALSQREVDTLE